MRSNLVPLPFNNFSHNKRKRKMCVCVCVSMYVRAKSKIEFVCYRP